MKDEVIGFVSMEPKGDGPLDGPACHNCGAIMVRSMQDVFAEKPKKYWFCETCGTTKE